MKETTWTHGRRYMGTIEELLAAGIVRPEQIPEGFNGSMTFWNGRRIRCGRGHRFDDAYIQIIRYKGNLKVYRGDTALKAKMRAAEEAREKVVAAERAERDAMNRQVDNCLRPMTTERCAELLRGAALECVLKLGLNYEDGFAPFMVRAMLTPGLREGPRRPDAAAA